VGNLTLGNAYCTGKFNKEDELGRKAKFRYKKSAERRFFNY